MMDRFINNFMIIMMNRFIKKKYDHHDGQIY